MSWRTCTQRTCCRSRRGVWGCPPYANSTASGEWACCCVDKAVNVFTLLSWSFLQNDRMDGKWKEIVKNKMKQKWQKTGFTCFYRLPSPQDEKKKPREIAVVRTQGRRMVQQFDSGLSVTIRTWTSSARTCTTATCRNAARSGRSGISRSASCGLQADCHKCCSMSTA